MPYSGKRKEKSDVNSRNANGNTRKRGTKGATFAGLLAAIIVGISTKVFGGGYENIGLGGFSPDGQKLLLTACKEDKCTFGFFDFAGHRFFPVLPFAKDQTWSFGSYSPDGKHIAVAIRRFADGGSDSQIGIVDIEGKRVIEVTEGQGFRAAPSFSADGKTIIFARSNRQRRSGKTRFSDWDVYELTLTTRTERQLTDFKFFSLASPAYVQDGSRFIFSGEGPRNPGAERGQMGSEDRRHLQGSRIFLLSRGERKLVPLFEEGAYASFPQMSKDGRKIVYAKRTDIEDGIRTRYAYDLFLHENGTHRRLTHQHAIVMGTSMMADGAAVAFVTDAPSGAYKNNHRMQLWLLRLESLALSRVDLATGQLPILE